MRNLFKSGKGVAAPHIVWSLLFIILPLIFVVYFAFTDGEGVFTLQNIFALSEHTETFALSVSLSVIATFFCFIVGYPLAYLIARSSPKKQKLYIMLLMLPMWTNLLIRTYSMMAIMDDGGMINTFLRSLDLNTFRMIGTKGAVIFGMAYDFFPYMVMPIYTVVSKIDNSLLEAAADLGCSPLRTMTKVVLPCISLSIPSCT